MTEVYIVPSTGDTLSVGRASKPVQDIAFDGALACVRAAGGSVFGHRAVIFNALGQVANADNTNLAHSAAVAGISRDAGSLGDPIMVVMAGEVEEVSWLWTPQGEVYLNGPFGQLSQTAPTSGFCLSVGFAVSATVLKVRIGRATILA